MSQMQAGGVNELDGQILWFEALLDAIEDEDYEDAIRAVKAYIALLRRQRKEIEWKN